MSDVYVCYTSKQACKSRGVWGDAPPGNFQKLDALRLLLRLFFDKAKPHSSYYFIQYLAVLHAFAKPPDFKFP